MKFIHVITIIFAAFVVMAACNKNGCNSCVQTVYVKEKRSFKRPKFRLPKFKVPKIRIFKPLKRHRRK